MTNALERLFEGIVAALRADVIPHIDDPFGRGQAVGMVDLIGAIAARVEWKREPLIESVREKRRLLARVAEAPRGPEAVLEPMSSAELAAERARLDAEICEAMRRAHARGQEPAAREALALLIAHAHDEAAEAMKLTRKPSFGEISSGKDDKSVVPRG